VGKTITTEREEIVQVMLDEEDGEDRVLLLERGTAAPSAAKPPRKGTARGSRR
jgi:hypothetical protein